MQVIRKLFGIFLISSSVGALCAAAPGDSSLQPHHIDARMLREPAVSKTQIAFVYAGDIWVAPKDGGVAMRLSSPRGEESFPRFSPDGNTLAFSGDYDGNEDIYEMPVTGGVPRRITHHGAPDRMLGWYPDGKSILFASTMTSYKDRFNQLWKVSANGGLPEKLPMPYGEFGEISPDGKKIAYIPISRDFRTWKRYRGGMNPDIWLFDLENLTATNMTQNPASDSQPMWHGDTIYFLSDRDENKRENIWAYDTKSNSFRQVTHFTKFDIHFPSVGPDDIVFENAGQLYLLDLATEKYHSVEIQVVTDRATLKPQLRNVSNLIQDASISPTGKRVLFEARGEIFSAPAEHGIVRDLTRTSGSAERFPAWSPDGKWIAYFSDKTGEYELTLRNADYETRFNTETTEETVSHLGPGFRYTPQWSPDSKRIVFIDQAMKVHLFDLDSREDTVIDQEKWMYQDSLSAFSVGWSADSRWIAYPEDQENRHTALALYDTKSGKKTQVTSGFYNDDDPVFDPDGKYLYFRTGRSFSPIYSDEQDTWIYANTERLAAVPLRNDVPSPLAPRDDEEKIEKNKQNDTEKPEHNGPEKAESDSGKSKRLSIVIAPEENFSAPEVITKKSGGKVASPKDTEKSSGDKEKKTETKENKKGVDIDLVNFEERAILLPTKAGHYDDLTAVSGKLIYRWLPRDGSGDNNSPVEYYDLEKRETKRILNDADGIELSANREKLLVRRGNDYAIVEPKESQNFDKPIDTGDFEAMIDPVAEWHQIFNDAWRFYRDYFYDPDMHGVDWDQMRVRYGKLLDDAVTRWDVNYVIGELIGELNSSHTYRGGGDEEHGAHRGVGYLGVNFALENGAYRIKKIIDGAQWDNEVRSPLREPGLNVKEGDYLLAVNGQPLDVTQDPWAAFQGLADKTVMLTVNSKPGFDGARDVLVKTLDSEARLRNLAWINANREKVDKASDGRIGYVYVPDTAQHGQNELFRQWRGQIDKEGLIVDERFNSGGQIPDRFVELLDRPLRNYWGVRDGEDWTWPPFAQFGPKAMLINGWSGSGGDCFPYYFRQSKLGPLIGERTWGGLIGITGVPSLIDGGSVTVPTFGIYSTQGKWIIEGAGVNPDIEVVDDPGEMARGHDPQLEAAIAEVMKQLKEQPPEKVKKPAYPRKPGT